MKENFDYDVTVIGAGIAGMVAAVTASGLGKKVAIVEKRCFGGNCSSFTCLPSKALIRAGHVANLLQNLDNYGFRLKENNELDSTKLFSHVKNLRDKFVARDAAETFEAVGIKTIIGPARFQDSHHIGVNGMDISSRYFIIATGTRPMIPPIQGLSNIPFLTNETLYNLTTLPRSIIILGGGVAGLEFASSLARLGVRVSIVEMSSRLLPSDDRELTNLLLDPLQNSGIQIFIGAKAVSFSSEGELITLMIENSQGELKKLDSESVLLTAGRKVDIENLNLDQVGVGTTPRGIVVSETLQTSVSNIYACGDVVGPYQLASSAEYQGITAAVNAVLPVKRRMDYTNAIFVIFTDPPLARLGLTEEQARKKYNDNIRVYRSNYSNIRRAIVDRTECGLAKIICNRWGQVVGSHILGESAPEIIHELQVIKGFNIPLHSVQSLTHAYPTYAQAVVGRASQLAYLDHMSSNFFVSRFLKFIPGYQNRLGTAKQRLAEDRDIFSTTGTDIANTGLEVTGRFGDEIITRINRIAPNICLVELDAELTHLDEKPILLGCYPQQTAEKGYLLLDFGAVKLINGLGASMLVKLATFAKKHHQQVLACGVNDHYRDVLKVTGLDRITSVYSTREEALTAIGEPTLIAPVRETKKTVQPQDTAFWAKPVVNLQIPSMPAAAMNLNLQGRKVVGPVLGFGQLWQKRYHLIIEKPELTSEGIIDILKRNFPSFQPSYNRFYPSSKGIQPGELVAIDSSTAGGPVSTGVMVLYADTNSFTFITPQGHPESGWVNFNAFSQGSKIIVQIVGLARANDPVYEAAFRAVGSKLQIRIWTYLLNSLAMYLGVPANVAVEVVRIDPALQWSQFGNIWYNAQIRTILHSPRRWLRKPGKGNSRRKD